MAKEEHHLFSQLSIYDAISKCMKEAIEGICILDAFSGISEFFQYDGFVKSALNQTCCIIGYVGTYQSKYINSFVIREEDTFELLYSKFVNPDMQKSMRDFERIFTKKEENFEMKSEEDIEETEIQKLDLMEWENLANYFCAKNSELNKAQRLRLHARVFYWYNGYLAKILQTTMQNVDRIKGDPEESRQLFNEQCRRLKPAVDHKYEEVQNFPQYYSYFADNAIDHLIAEKQLKEDDIPTTCYHRFTQEALFKHLVYKRIVENQKLTIGSEAVKAKQICNDPLWDKHLKDIICQLPSLMEIKKNGRITGLHVASLLKWCKDQFKRAGQNPTVKIEQKALLEYIHDKLGKDYKVFNNPSNITEAMKILEGKPTHVSQEKRDDHILKYSKYKDALDKKFNQYQEQQSA